MNTRYLDWSEFHNRLILEAQLTMDTALRIGSGDASTAVGPYIPVVRNALGQPYIPGSSFKGVLRSIVERFARTVDCKPDLWACEDPLALKNPRNGACVPSKGKGENGERKGKDLLLAASQVNGQVDERAFTNALVAHTCTVCRLFGSPWLASKIQVKDLVLDEVTWLGHVELRYGVAIDRDTRTAAPHHLYQFETVPAGTEFRCEIIAENINPLEIGLLMLGLRQMQEGQVSLGGARSRGLGWATLSDLTAGWVDGKDKNRLLDYVTQGKVEQLSSVQLQEYIKSLKAVVAGGGV